MDNLTFNLMPKDAPIVQNQGMVSAYEFDSHNERNVIDLQKIKNLTISSLTAGTITVQLSVGGPNLIIDGENNRIIVNDGTVDRILIGQLTGGF